ncbi:MAG: MBL fold metallo-hydrolase [Candidatus Xenobia bacterium]
MHVSYLGHSSFLFTGQSGFRMLTDPYDETVGYRQPQKAAEVTLISHDHWDHNNLRGIPGRTRVITGCGTHRVAEDVEVRGVLAWHDDVQGARFGAITMFAFQLDQVRVAFLSDLGHHLSPTQVAALGPIDLLCLPVGGHYTIDGLMGQAVMEQFPDARIVIPMHYRTPSLDRSRFPISGVEPFLKGMRGVRYERTGELAVPPLPEHRQIVVMTPQY